MKHVSNLICNLQQLLYNCFRMSTLTFEPSQTSLELLHSLERLDGAEWQMSAQYHRVNEDKKSKDAPVGWRNWELLLDKLATLGKDKVRARRAGLVVGSAESADENAVGVAQQRERKLFLRTCIASLPTHSTSYEERTLSCHLNWASGVS